MDRDNESFFLPFGVNLKPLAEHIVNKLNHRISRMEDKIKDSLANFSKELGENNELIVKLYDRDKAREEREKVLLETNAAQAAQLADAAAKVQELSDKLSQADADKDEVAAALNQYSTELDDMQKKYGDPQLPEVPEVPEQPQPDPGVPDDGQEGTGEGAGEGQTEQPGTDTGAGETGTTDPQYPATGDAGTPVDGTPTAPETGTDANRNV